MNESGKQKYNVKTKFNDRVDYEILTSFYLPIIGSKAFSLYLYLSTEGRNTKESDETFFPEERILKTLNLSPSELNKCLKKLEVINLITIYKKKRTRDKYTFLINNPLSYNEIIKNSQLTFLLFSKLGEENFELNKQNFKKSFQSLKEGFELTTKEIEININETPKKTNISNEFNVKIDEKSFYENLDLLEIDYSKWSDSFKKYLLNNLILYEIKSTELLSIILSLKEEGLTINRKNVNKILDDLDIKKRTDINHLVDIDNTRFFELIKKTPTIEFLQILLDRSLTDEEENLVTFLKVKNNFNDDFINLLFNHSYIVNDGVIVVNYIKKISQTIIKRNISSLEELKSHLKKAFSFKHKRTKLEPPSNPSRKSKDNILSEDERVTFDDDN